MTMTSYESVQNLTPYNPTKPLRNALMDPNEDRLYYCSNGGRKHFTTADSCVLPAFVVGFLLVVKSECLILFALHNANRRKQRPCDS